ncbi:MAG TPA: hypothetical protein VFR40_04905 [Lapillicoccus sp.]|nr:hypothetical protein [Lapillicoccus sp.]
MRTAPGSGRYLATVIGIPVLVVALGLALVAASWAQLAPVVATHWGPNGVDGTQGRLAFTVTAAVIVAILCGLLGLVGWFLPPDGRRVMAAVVGVMGGFLPTVLFGALLGQRGVTDPSQATLSPWLFLVAVLVGAVLGGIAWWANPVQPRPATAPIPVPPDAPRIPLADGERLVWFGWSAPAPWIGWIAVALVVLGCLVAVTAAPWAAIGPAIAIVILLLSAHARVVVDAEGLRVTSAGILRWLRVPLDTVAYADRSELQALRDFGGLGLRFRTDARAFVTRSGPALEVVQRDGTRTYVTMDRPDEAAAVLNGLVSRAERS